MKILLINHYYPPDTAATAYVFKDIAEALSSAGHNVTVVCGRPSYDPLRRSPWRVLSKELTNSVAVERVGSFAMDRRRLKGRVANYVSFLAAASVRVLVTRRPDAVVVGSDPPLAVLVGLLAARGKPVIYSLRDLHPDASLAAGIVRHSPLTHIWDAIHTFAIKKCSLVICLGEAMAARLAKKGLPVDRIEIVPDGAWPIAGEPDPAIVAEIRQGADFLVMHAGNLGGVGAWDCLLKAKLQLNGLCKWVAVGSGMQAGRLEKEGITVIPFRPQEEIPSVMAAGDLQLVSQRPGTEGVVMPSKLYTILTHGRPVLAVVPSGSEVAQIVRRHGCGLVADPNDPKDVATQIQWACANREALADMGRKAGEAAAGFERGSLLTRFVKLVEERVTSP